MATMALKDMILCPVCGAEMFPSAFDRAARKISYKCTAAECAAETECSFEEVRLGDGERYHSFCLNDDGDATWKCHRHGHCDLPIDSLLDKDFTKFQTCCCILGLNEEELEEEADHLSNEGKEQISRILSVLDEEQVLELVNELCDEDVLENCDDDYAEALAQQFFYSECDTVDEFINWITDEIYSLFEISIDEDGNLLDDEE